MMLRMRSRRSARRAIGLALLLLAVPLVLTFGGCADRLLLFPSRNAIDAGGLVGKKILRDGHVIETWTARSARAEDREPAAFVLEFCGNATRAEQITKFIAHRWRDWPVEVWVMNYPGFGGSDGPARLASIPPAALATYDALAQVAGDRPIFLAGKSMGATSALYVASKRPAAGLILQNAPPLRAIILQRHGWWNLWLAGGPIAWQVPPELNATGTAPHVHAPAVFLVAEQDTLVPPRFQQMVIDAYAGPKHVISLANTGHNDPVGTGAEALLRDAIRSLWQGEISSSTAPSSAPFP
jgi:hypothetical protein